jgi:hypothetical protein
VYGYVPVIQRDGSEIDTQAFVSHFNQHVHTALLVQDLFSAKHATRQLSISGTLPTSVETVQASSPKEMSAPQNEQQIQAISTPTHAISIVEELKLWQPSAQSAHDPFKRRKTRHEIEAEAQQLGASKRGGG